MRSRTFFPTVLVLSMLNCDGDYRRKPDAAVDAGPMDDAGDAPDAGPTARFPTLPPALINEVLGNRENFRSYDESRLVLGSVGRRVWAISLTEEPGFVGDVNYIHERGYGGSNIGGHILDVAFSADGAPLAARFLSHRYWPDHLRVESTLGGAKDGLVLQEDKFITGDDCMVDVMRLVSSSGANRTIDLGVTGSLLSSMTVEDGVGLGAASFRGQPSKFAAAADGLSPVLETVSNNAAHNPEGFGMPEPSASFTFWSDSEWAAIDGDHSPTPRWTSYGSGHTRDSLTIDFGREIDVDRLVVDVLDDAPAGQLRSPTAIEVRVKRAGTWHTQDVTSDPAVPAEGLNTLTFASQRADAIRLGFTHAPGRMYTGVSEVEVYPAIERTRTALRGSVTVPPGGTVSATATVCMGLAAEDVAGRARAVAQDADPLATHTATFQGWFDDQAPRFWAPDAAFEHLWWYRWFVVRYNLSEIGAGNLVNPAFYEGREYYSRVIQFSTPHILDETRWLRDGRFAYGHLQNMVDHALEGALAQFDGELPYLWVDASSSFWFINWIERAAWGLYQVHPQGDFGARFLPAFERDMRGQLNRYDPDGDLLPKLGGDDSAFFATGMEYQPAFYWFSGDIYQDPATYPDIERTDFAAYWYGNARALAEMEARFGTAEAARSYSELADGIREAATELMWDPADRTFYDLREEDHEPARVMEIVGFFPWAFDLPPEDRPEMLEMFDHLLDPSELWAPYPPSTISRTSEFFSQTVPGGCCHWNGPTWPFATSLVVNALAEAVKHYGASDRRQAFWALLTAYTNEQFEGGDLTLPLVSESMNGDTGDWKSQVDSYFHSSWIDLVIRHVVGLTPRADETIELDPIPNDWPYFAISHIAYHDRDLTIVWDVPDGDDQFDDGIEGLSVWDGDELLLTNPRLEHLTWDPATGSGDT